MMRAWHAVRRQAPAADHPGTRAHAAAVLLLAGLVTAVPAPVARADHRAQALLPADDAALRALVPQKLLSVEEAIAESLRQEREHRTIARWTDGVFALRGFRHDHAYYSKRAGGRAVARATPAALWLWITRSAAATATTT
jgi:hypothetical protein